MNVLCLPLRVSGQGAAARSAAAPCYHHRKGGNISMETHGLSGKRFPAWRARYTSGMTTSTSLPASAERAMASMIAWL